MMCISVKVKMLAMPTARQMMMQSTPVLETVSGSVPRIRFHLFTGDTPAQACTTWLWGH